MLRYDLVLRDAALKGARDFRPCPLCKAGGFVTWSCVGVARDRARRVALFVGVGLIALCGALGANGALMAAADLTGPPHVAVLASAALMHAVGVLARRAARDASADAPLHVGCPECDARFDLAAPDVAADAAAASRGRELDASAGDAAWVREHTRPCPRCRAPIIKSGGCNAMRCGRCHHRFCWACMQSQTRCGHFQCANGAPHGNASPWDTDQANDGERMAAAGNRAAGIAHVGAIAVESLAGGALLVRALALAQVHVPMPMLGSMGVPLASRWDARTARELPAPMGGAAAWLAAEADALLCLPLELVSEAVAAAGALSAELLSSALSLSASASQLLLVTWLIAALARAAYPPPLQAHAARPRA